MSTTQLVVALAGVVVVGAAVFARSRSLASRRTRDPQRLFTAAQRAAGFARAGNRCEHISAWGLRCTARPTHADHVYPWSAGGATAMSNLAALCATHNTRKGAKIPSSWTMWRLSRRRRKYFPADEPTDIQWRIGLAS